MNKIIIPNGTGMTRIATICLKKFLNLIVPCRFIVRQSVSSVVLKGSTMDKNTLLPPPTVKGMTSLDKEKFQKQIRVPSLYIPCVGINKLRKSLKRYLLKLQNFNPVKPWSEVEKQIDESILDKITGSDVEIKVLILDPLKIATFDDIELQYRKELESSNILKSNFFFLNIFIGYDNWKADEILRAIVPTDLESISSYSVIGHIVHLNLKEHLTVYKEIIGQVLIDKIKNARTVVNKVDSIDSKFRNFEMELLAGDNEMMTNVKENGCTFEFDFSMVYWNPRLSTEHERIVEKLEKGDILYDIFAGVGPFSIPAAKKGCIVLANDLNPESYKWLCHNTKLNKVDKLLKAFNKDGGEFIRTDLKKHLMSLPAEKSYNIHITMNLPALAINFLPVFKGLLLEEELSNFEKIPTPFVYIYCFTKGLENPYNAAREMLETEMGYSLNEEIIDVSYVRKVAPNKEMMRVTILLSKKILLNLEKRKFENSEIGNNKKICI